MQQRNINISPNLAAPIPESKTAFQNYIHCDSPCLSTINFTNLLENTFASLKTDTSSTYYDISADVTKKF